MRVLLRGGPGDGQVVAGGGGGETVVWRACLYEITPERTHHRDADLRIYQHRPDCCETYGRGAEDLCE